MIRRLIQSLRVRRAISDCGEVELREMVTLLMLAGRRCTHDLGHALSDLPRVAPDDWRASLHQRLHAKHDYWRAVFYPDDGGKNYRGQLHRQLDEAHSQVARLEALCRANGIDPTDPNGMPF